jgi:hypothetical protein
MIVTDGSAYADVKTPVLPINIRKNMIFLDIMNLRLILINKNLKFMLRNLF